MGLPSGIPSMPLPFNPTGIPSMAGGFPPMPTGFPPMNAASPGFPHLSGGFAPPPPPPMFPAGDGHQVLNNSEALHSMLMSWYMAGFHTGQFQAHSRPQSRKNKKDKD